MHLPDWVNTVVCDKGFIEKGVLAELREAGKQKKKIICISAAAGWNIKHQWVAVEFVFQKNYLSKDCTVRRRKVVR